MRVTLLTIILTLLGVNSWAELPAPPVLKNYDVNIQQYFKQLYDNHNVLKVITSSPNGAREGSSGEIVILNTNNVFTIWVNQGGTVWVEL